MERASVHSRPSVHRGHRVQAGEDAKAIPSNSYRNVMWRQLPDGCLTYIKSYEHCGNACMGTSIVVGIESKPT